MQKGDVDRPLGGWFSRISRRRAFDEIGRSVDGADEIAVMMVKVLRELRDVKTRSRPPNSEATAIGFIFYPKSLRFVLRGTGLAD